MEENSCTLFTNLPVCTFRATVGQPLSLHSLLSTCGSRSGGILFLILPAYCILYNKDKNTFLYVIHKVLCDYKSRGREDEYSPLLPEFPHVTGGVKVA